MEGKCSFPLGLRDFSLWSLLPGHSLRQDAMQGWALYRQTALLVAATERRDRKWQGQNILQRVSSSEQQGPTSWSLCTLPKWGHQLGTNHSTRPSFLGKVTAKPWQKLTSQRPWDRKKFFFLFFCLIFWDLELKKPWPGNPGTANRQTQKNPMLKVQPSKKEIICVATAQCKTATTVLLV